MTKQVRKYRALCPSLKQSQPLWLLRDRSNLLQASEQPPRQHYQKKMRLLWDPSYLLTLHGTDPLSLSHQVTKLLRLMTARRAKGEKKKKFQKRKLKTRRKK